MLTIGIIGAQGKFGSKLSSKIEQVYGQNINLIKTVDKLHNPELTKKSDIVILTVPPSEVENVTNEISGSLKAQTEFVSFAAGIALSKLQERGTSNPMRAMMDPDATIGTLLKSGNENTLFEEVLAGILQQPMQFANSDQYVNEFTVGISYLFTVLLWSFQEHANEALDWAAPYLDLVQTELKLYDEALQSIVENIEQEGDFTQKLQQKATKGGITETLIEELKRNPNIEALALYSAGMDRMNQVVNQLN